MPVDEPGVERILPGQRLPGEAVRLSWQSEEGRESSRHVGRSGEGGEDRGGVEAGEREAGVNEGNISQNFHIFTFFLRRPLED